MPGFYWKIPRYHIVPVSKQTTTERAAHQMMLEIKARTPKYRTFLSHRSVRLGVHWIPEIVAHTPEKILPSASMPYI